MVGAERPGRHDLVGRTLRSYNACTTPFFAEAGLIPRDRFVEMG